MRQWLLDLERRHGREALSQKTRRLVLISFVVLLGLVMLRGFQVQGDEYSWRPVLAFVLPLLLFLPSIIGKRPRGHAWLAFVSLLYIAQGVMFAAATGQFLRGALEIAAAAALFFGSLGYARFGARKVSR
ncbi:MULTISPECIES: DUF2069 domain-containing protein [unclassified Halomonas]|uniref:DUF2069 domain-containing protein n=1 Tax=unclassified Halomonas TaxID=2609666 RepID=UPI0021E51436|nr:MULTISPECIES: DUF2069 domain-containing protein [unclassified Halomonas]UYF98388.1 DUF2069 domain-containing protein [Halomonas sp. GD1P12]WNL40489.1 DUF2069 domain-containing protein [Halomonas sp. PAMB 3232]